MKGGDRNTPGTRHSENGYPTRRTPNVGDRKSRLSDSPGAASCGVGVGVRWWFMRDEEPTWRPVTDIDMVTAIAVQSLAFAQEHLDTVGPVRPYVLDDHTVARMLRVWRNAKDNNALLRLRGVMGWGWLVFGFGDRIGPQVRMPREAKLVVLVKP